MHATHDTLGARIGRSNPAPAPTSDGPPVGLLPGIGRDLFSIGWRVATVVTVLCAIVVLLAWGN